MRPSILEGFGFLYPYPAAHLGSFGDMIWSTELIFHGGFEQPGLKMLKNSPNLLNQENDEKKTYGIWGYVPFCTLFFQTLTWKTGWNLQKTSPVIFHSCDHTTGARLGIPVIPTPCGMGNSIHSRGHEKSIAVGMLNHLNSGMGIICFFFQSRTETWRIEEIVGPLIPVRYLGVQVQFKVDIFNEKLWKITMFNEKINYKWPFSIAMLVYQRVWGPHIPPCHLPRFRAHQCCPVRWNTAGSGRSPFLILNGTLWSIEIVSFPFKNGDCSIVFCMFTRPGKSSNLTVIASIVMFCNKWLEELTNWP